MLQALMDNLILRLRRFDSVQYGATNEDLRSIISGLDLNPYDTVLAVVGSGDQVFAISQYADVIAVDHDKASIDYLLFRMRALEKGHRSCFLPDSDLNFYDRRSRNDYFTEERIEAIRGSHGKINVLEPMDIYSAMQLGGFNKIYLSNVLSYDAKRLQKYYPSMFARIEESLPEGGLLYISDAESITDWLGLDSNQFNLTPRLVLHQELTAEARKYYSGGWMPSVFIKVDENLRQDNLLCLS